MHWGQIRSYLAASVDAAAGSKWQYGLNFAGLVVAFGFFTLASAYVYYETHYENWVPGYERTYRLEKLAGEGEKQRITSVLFRTPALYLRENDARVEDVLDIIISKNASFAYAGKTVFGNSANASSGIISFLGLQITEGTAVPCAKGTDCILLSQALSRKLFGEQSPIGKTLQQKHSPPTVIGVYRGLPTNSHFDFDSIAFNDKTNVGSLFGISNIYVKLKQPTKQRLNVFPQAGQYVAKKYRELVLSWNLQDPLTKAFTYNIIPISEVHFAKHTDRTWSNSFASAKPPDDIEQTMRISAVAVLILGLAAFNFSGLLLSLSSSRLQEMALRKLSGTSNLTLAGMVVTETALLVLLAVAVGIGAAYLFAPIATAFFGVSFSLVEVLSSGLVGWLALAVLLLVFITAALPVLSIYKLKPAAVFMGVAGNIARNSVALFGFVTLQFILTILVLIAAFAIVAQYQKSSERPFHFNTKNIIAVDLRSDVISPEKRTFIDTVTAHPSIGRSVLSSGVPILSGDKIDSPAERKKEAVRAATVHFQAVDKTFFALYRVDAVAGRLFEKTSSIVAQARINEYYAYGKKYEAFRAKNRQRQENGEQLSKEEYERLEPKRPFMNADGKPDWTQGAIMPAVIDLASLKILGFNSPEDALGETIALADHHPSETGRFTIIGVIRSLDHDWNVRSPKKPTVYVTTPWSFAEQGGYASFEWLGSDRAGMMAHLQEAWQKYWPGHLIKATWIEADITAKLAPERKRMQMFIGLAGLVLVISMLGLNYAVQFTARAMRAEMTVRKVFGTAPTAIIGRIFWTFAKPLLVANLIAWPIAWYLLNQWLQNYADRIDISPLFFLGAGAVSLLAMVVVVGSEAWHMATSSPADDLAEAT
jgi:putative ABC transport system permease protein